MHKRLRTWVRKATVSVFTSVCEEEREGEREEERERECENAFPCGDVENENVIERRRESEYKNLMDVSWLTLVQSKT